MKKSKNSYLIIILLGLLLFILVNIISFNSFESITGYSIFNIFKTKNIVESYDEPVIASDNVISTFQINDYHKERLIVKFKKGVNENQRKGLYKRFGVNEKENIEGIVRVISVSENSLEKIKSALSKNPMIEFVEKDYITEALEIPNDPRWNDGYYVDLMDFEGAWNISKGLSEVIVANLDTGIDMDHPDLLDILLVDLSYNSAEENSDTEDLQGHGTKTAGSLAANTNNNVGIASVEWYKKIIPTKITSGSSRTAYLSDISQAAKYAVDNGAKVISVSFSGSCSSTISSVGAYVKQKGGLYLTSAGNDNILICNDGNNIENPNIIQVAATTSSDTKASYSNYGPDVDISAPGSSILTTTRGGSYGYASGTSFASPLAASVATLLFSAYPGASNVEVENALFNGVDDLGTPGRDDYFGYGRVNAKKALLAMGEPINDIIPPQVNINVPSEGQVILGDITIIVGSTDQYGINKVELYVDNNIMDTIYGDQNSFDFFLDVSNYINGLHEIQAISYDNHNNSNYDNVNVELLIDNSPPTINITFPSEGQIISDKFLRPATDTSENTDSVDFYINGEFEETDYSAPFSMNKINTKHYFGMNLIILAIAHAPNSLTAEDSVNFKIAGSSSSRDPITPKPECSDKIDNDNDGLIDYCKNSRSTGCDLDCSSRTDNSESS